MTKEVIILAGGLGTRLRSVVADVPKCMAPINRKPFIGIIIGHLLSQGFQHFYISAGYKSEVVIDYIQLVFPNISYTFILEESPLGTGGAIKKCCSSVKEESVLVVNGDTFFDVNYEQLYQFNEHQNSDCILCLKPMHDFDRYGVVETSDDFKITSFKEKKYYKEGLINGGIYLLKTKLLEELSLPEKFSFEKDFLEQYYQSLNFYGFVDKGYFIDIGIPEDYNKAQQELLQYTK